MKSFGAISGALLSLLLALPASARHACVSFADANTEASSNHPSVSPSVARLLLAQRLGLSQYHSFGDVDEDAIDLLNAHSRGQQQLDDGRQRVVVFLEGVHEPD
ncbi:MAG: hypothetical protein Q9162_007932, partial [Coniocarpon cinnabarinum]